MSYCHGTAAWNQRRRLVHSVWSASVFDTRVVSLILNAVPPEGRKQIQCDTTVTVELYRLEKTNIPVGWGLYFSQHHFSLHGITVSACWHNLFLIARLLICGKRKASNVQLHYYHETWYATCALWDCSVAWLLQHYACRCSVYTKQSRYIRWYM